MADDGFDQWLSPDDGQSSNIQRCRDKLAGAILEFCRRRLNGSPDFYAEDLRRCCEDRMPGSAPDSPGRILRLLRQEGLIDYIILSRRDSHYRITKVNHDG